MKNFKEESKTDEKYIMILKNIRTLIKYNNMSVSEFAKSIGYAESSMYSKIFSGQRNLSLHNLIAISNFFKISLNELVSHEFKIKQELIK